MWDTVIYIVHIHQSAVFLNVKPSWPCIRSEVMAAQRATETPLNHTYFIGFDSKYTWAVFKRVSVFHYTHLVLSQILSRCFRDHTPGFRAMNIWQNCFRGAFAIFGKPIRSKQPVIHIYHIYIYYIWYDASLLNIGQSATYTHLKGAPYFQTYRIICLVS